MHREAYEAARRLGNARAAFKIDDEWEKYRELYGDSAFGRGCLLARRLVEAGVPFVEVGQSSYDIARRQLRRGTEGLSRRWNMPGPACSPICAERGLFDNTLIIWAGEIGRTPSINNRAGRDHYRALLVHGPGRLRHQGGPGLRRVGRRTASR